MVISDTSYMIDGFTIALLTAEFGQVWAEYVCHDVTPQLWRKSDGIVCTISFERPVNYLCDAWHVFPPKYEVWTHFNN